MVNTTSGDAGIPSNPNVISDMFEAACQNDTDKIRSILYRNPQDVNQLRDEDNRTLLMVATRYSSVDVVKFLATLSGVQLDLQDDKGETALYHAAAIANIQICEELINAGADVNLANLEMMTPLFIAASIGHSQVCAILVDKGHADINYQDNSFKTPLISAVYEGHTSCVEVLSARGANLNVIDQYGWTALMLGAFFGRTEACYILLKHGADVSIMADGKDAQALARDAGNRPLADAIAKGHGRVSIIADVSQAQHRQRNSRRSILSGFDLGNTSPAMAVPATRHSTASYNGMLMPKDPSGKRVALQPKFPRRPPKVSETEPAQWGFGSLWSAIVFLLTCCIPDLFLGKKDKGAKKAWREKVVLCMLSLFVSGIITFLAFGLSPLACKTDIKMITQADLISMQGMVIRGQAYQTTVNSYIGQDVSSLFPVNPATSQCKYPLTTLPAACNFGNDTRNCYSSPVPEESFDQFNKGLWLTYSWERIRNVSSDNMLFVYKDKVYNVSAYLDPQNTNLYLGPQDQQMAIRDQIATFVGRDATLEISWQDAKFQDLQPCFNDQFLVGMIEGQQVTCKAAQSILLLQLIFVLTITIIKFSFAIGFHVRHFRSQAIKRRSPPPFPKSDRDTSYVIILVTCYSENEEMIRNSLDSLALCDYSDRHKLFFLIADGDVTGSGNTMSTPDICKSIIDLQETEEPEMSDYMAIGTGSKQHNRAKVYSGFYKAKGHSVPIILVHKCGSPAETGGPKAGNRGKRDSQIILMNFLSRVTFNKRMTPLDYEIFEKIYRLTKVTADRYNLLLMVDADTQVKEDSLGLMVDVMEKDVEIMGLCGEVKVANKKQSWVSMIQVFDYYTSHHFGKAFESMFGCVICLPGCFCMYRIKAPKHDGYMVPILANPEVIHAYSYSPSETLHQKNLVILGEDRFLTTLMLRVFPNRKTIYAPQAVCKTVVPDEFQVLLSQRRRWINSTVHHLMEIALVPRICGSFCFSMQFVALIDIINTAVLPEAFLLLIVVIILGIIGYNVFFSMISLAGFFGLQALVAVFTTRKPIYVMWLFIYILAMPIWNFVLPAYSFWHFDHFTWGATRQIQGKDTGHDGDINEKFDPSVITMKKWSEWKTEKRQNSRLSAGQEK